MAGERLISILVKAQDEASKVLKEVGDNAEKSSKGLDIAKKGLVALGAAAATAAAAAAAFAVKSVNAYLETGDALAKMSIKTGVSVTGLGRLKYAAELSDVSLEQLSGGLKKLNVNMGTALEGNETMVKSFERIGLSADQLKTMDTEQVFLQINDAIMKTKDPVEQAAIAFDLLGKTGQEMLPLLTGDLVELGDEAERMGQVMGTDAAKAAEEFNDNITRAKAVVSSIGLEIAGQLMPILSDLLTKVLDAAKRFFDWYETMGGITGIKDTLVAGIGEMITQIDLNTGLVTALKNTWATLVLFFKENLQPALQRLMEAIQPFMPALEFLAKLIGAVLVGALHIFIALVKTVLLAVFATITAAVNILSGTLEFLAKAWDWIVDKFKTVIEWGQKVVDTFNRIIKAAREAMSFVGGGISSAVGTVKSTVSNIGSALGFAEGGIVTRPTFAMIGEAGESEAVIPLSKLPSLIGAGGGGAVININGGYYLSEDAARDMADKLMDILKLNRKL